MWCHKSISRHDSGVCDLLSYTPITRLLLFYKIRCQNFMTLPVGIFKSYSHIDADIDMQEKWLSLLPKPLRLKEAKRNLEKHITPSSSMSHVRNVVFACHVSQRWNVPFKDALNWVEEGIKTLPFSVRRLLRALTVLANVGFDQNLASPTWLCMWNVTDEADFFFNFSVVESSFLVAKRSSQSEAFRADL